MVTAGCFAAGVGNAFWIFNVKATHPSLASDREAMAKLIGSDTGPAASTSFFIVASFIVASLSSAVYYWPTPPAAHAWSPDCRPLLLGVSLPGLWVLTDRWAAIAGVLILVAFLLLAPLVARAQRSERYPLGGRGKGRRSLMHHMEFGRLSGLHRRAYAKVPTAQGELGL